jgi:hypothetical protein
MGIIRMRKETPVNCPKNPDHGPSTKRILPRNEWKQITKANEGRVYEIDCPICGKYEMQLSDAMISPDSNSGGIDPKTLERQDAHERMVVAKGRLEAAQAQWDSVRPQFGHPTTDEYHSANLAWINAAQEFSSSLVAYSDLLTRS